MTSPPPVVAPPAKGKRRKGLIILGLILVIGGLLGGGAVAVKSMSNYEEAVKSLARAPVGCTTTLVIDGRLSEEAWSHAEVADHFTQKDPDEGKAATERTEIRIMYDADALYIGAKMHDSEPAKIGRRLGSRDDYDTDSLQLCVSGGSAMPVEVLRGFDEAFGAKILEGYGLSETTGMGSFNQRDRERKPGSIGQPVGGTEMRLVDDDDNDVPVGERGEILMRGPFVMSGYWGRDDATADAMRGGWFHTGDIATVDDDGYYFIVDRKKDLIIRGGYNVYPREIEEVFYTHPDVLEVAVVAGVDV